MKTFTVELMVTEKCNLGCTYCYVANRNKSMTKEIFDEVLKKIYFYMKKMKCSKYEISYFGGEPLENFELVKYAHSIFKKDKLCAGETLISNLTLLTPEIADYIVNEKINVSFSFDGLSSNETRPLLPVKENKQFKKILDLYDSKWDLIQKVCPKMCHTVMSPDNIHLLSKNVDFLVSKGITCIDYAIDKDDVWTNESIEKFKYYYREYINNCINRIKNHERITGGLNYVSLIDSVIGLLGWKRHNSCFAGSTGCGVNASGEFFACARFASKNAFKYTSNLNYKEIFNQLDPYNYDKCKKCEIFHFCNQGCVFSQLRNNNEPIPSVCDIYKFIFKEMVRMVHELKDNETFIRIVEGQLRSLRRSIRGL